MGFRCPSPQNPRLAKAEQGTVQAQTLNLGRKDGPCSACFLSPPLEDLWEPGDLEMLYLNLTRFSQSTGAEKCPTVISGLQTTFLFLPCGEHINYLEGSISLCASERGSASLIEPGLEA